MQGGMEFMRFRLTHLSRYIQHMTNLLRIILLPLPGPLNYCLIRPLPGLKYPTRVITIPLAALIQGAQARWFSIFKTICDPSTLAKRTIVNSTNFCCCCLMTYNSFRLEMQQTWMRKRNIEKRKFNDACKAAWHLYGRIEIHPSQWAFPVIGAVDFFFLDKIGDFG